MVTCTQCFVFGPIDTEQSFLTARRLRQNNNRMLSKENSLPPASFFLSPCHSSSCHHFPPLVLGLTVSIVLEYLEEKQAGNLTLLWRTSRGLLLLLGFSVPPLLCFSSYLLAFTEEVELFLYLIFLLKQLFLSAEKASWYFLKREKF